MKIVVTGASGTVGRELCRSLVDKEHHVIPWNREDVPINNYHRMEHYLRAIQPDAIYHLAVASQSTGMQNESWMVTYEWTSELAWLTHILDIQFVFVSTVAVFSDGAAGPFAVDAVPDAESGYGSEKRQAESHARFQNKEMVIVRLGWQIGEKAGSNNMIDYFERKMNEEGEVKASNRWLPACSFLPDTAQALVDLLEKEKGVYHLDSNERWNFFQIASALNKKHGEKWRIVESEHFVFDQRLLDDRELMPALNIRLPELP